MFTARPDLDLERERRFAGALSAMSYDNPVHRPILDGEGLQRWLPPHVDGYDALRQAAAQQGFLKRVFVKSASS
jgi:ABC-type phosphate/phosphonate transport system substrate-binding protein